MADEAEGRSRVQGALDKEKPGESDIHWKAWWVTEEQIKLDCFPHCNRR